MRHGVVAEIDLLGHWFYTQEWRGAIVSCKHVHAPEGGIECNKTFPD